MRAMAALTTGSSKPIRIQLPASGSQVDTTSGTLSAPARLPEGR